MGGLGDVYVAPWLPPARCPPCLGNSSFEPVGFLFDSCWDGCDLGIYVGIRGFLVPTVKRGEGFPTCLKMMTALSMYSQTIPNDSSGNTGITTPWGMRMCGGMSAVGYVVAKFGSQNPAVYTLAVLKGGLDADLKFSCLLLYTSLHLYHEYHD